MSQILDALKGYITPELIAVAADKLGENNSGIGKAIGGLLPIILGGLADKSQNTSAFSNIFDMLKDNRNAGFLDDLGGLIGGGNLAHNDPKDISGRLMSTLFGPKVASIIDAVSSFAGVDKKSSSSLLGMVGPLIMGYLSKKIAKEGLGAMGLANLLGNQKSSIMSAIPGALAGQLGFASIKRGVSDTVATTAATASAATAATASGGSSLMKWLLPLLLVAGLGYLIYNMGGCGGTVDKVANTTGNMVDAAGDAANKAGDMASDAAGTMKDAAGNAVDAAGDAANKAGDMASDAARTVKDAAGNAVDVAGNAVKNLGAFFSRKMDCGVELNIPQNGIENQVITFIEDDSKAVDKTTWFNFDRLVFETSKSTLDMTKSEEQLKNIAAILKCYPKVKLKIGGYTDSSGAEDMNMKLSQNRANTVKSALVKLGIAANRLDAEGYGEQHPIASNDTEEGKAQNRRIAARVMAK